MGTQSCTGRPESDVEVLRAVRRGSPSQSCSAPPERDGRRGISSTWSHRHGAMVHAHETASSPTPEDRRSVGHQVFSLHALLLKSARLSAMNWAERRSAAMSSSAAFIRRGSRATASSPEVGTAVSRYTPRPIAEALSTTSSTNGVMRLAGAVHLFAKAPTESDKSVLLAGLEARGANTPARIRGHGRWRAAI